MLLALVISRRTELVDQLALLAWTVGGGVAMATDGLLALEARQRQNAHDRSGLRSVAGWRISGVGVDPDLLLALDLVAYLADRAQVTSVPVRGRCRRSRTTYGVPLRELAREWGRATGVSGRRADRILAEELCDRYGVVRRVPVGTTSAFRLVDRSTAGAITHLEQAAGCRLVAWELERDPRAASP